MDAAGGSSLVLARLPPADLLDAVPSRVPLACVRAHTHHAAHVVVVDAVGAFHIVQLAPSSAASRVVASMELQMTAGGGFTQPVRKACRLLELHEDNGFLICHRSSNKILFAQVPMLEGERGSVFLFGAHEGEVLCMAKTQRYLASGSADGCTKLWDLDSGNTLDFKRQPGASAVTAISFAGPLMVAVGGEHGDVCMYDISSGHLQAVQRIHVDEGPVTALACRLTPQHRHDAATASAPRGLDGGGLVAGPMGLPWRLPPYSPAKGDSRDAAGAAQLAVGSSAGWVHLLTATAAGEGAWTKQYSGAVVGEPCMSFSPDGMYLALASTGHPANRLTILDARSFQAVQQYAFGGALANAGFCMPTGSALVVLPRSLTAGIRLELFAAPARDLPVSVQLPLPLEPHHPDEQRAGQDAFLERLAQRAAAPVPSAAPLGPARGDALLGQRVGKGEPSAVSDAHSPLRPVRDSITSALAAPWTSPRGSVGMRGVVGAAAAAAYSPGVAAGASSAGSPAGTAALQAIRPTTLPAPRSWITGVQPTLGLGLTETGVPQGVSQSSVPALEPAAQPWLPRPPLPAAGQPERVSVEHPASAAELDAWADDGWDVELPHTGTLLPSSGVPAAGTGSSRYASDSVVDDDADLQLRALPAQASGPGDLGAEHSYGRPTHEAWLPRSSLPKPLAASSPNARTASAAQQQHGGLPPLEEAEEGDGDYGSFAAGTGADIGGGHAAWRWGALDMPDEGFSVAAAASGAPTAGTRPYAAPLGNLRFQPQRGTSQAAPQGRAEPASAERPLAEEEEELVRSDAGRTGGDDLRDGTLGRTAYFGDAFARLQLEGEAAPDDDDDDDGDDDGDDGGGDDDRAVRSSRAGSLRGSFRQQPCEERADERLGMQPAEQEQPARASLSQGHAAEVAAGGGGGGGSWQLPAQQSDPEDDPQQLQLPPPLHLGASPPSKPAAAHKQDALDQGGWGDRMDVAAAQGAAARYSAQPPHAGAVMEQHQQPSSDSGSPPAPAAHWGPDAYYADEGPDAQPRVWANQDVLSGDTTFRSPVKGRLNDAPRPALRMHPAPRQPTHAQHRMQVSSPYSGATAVGAGRGQARGRGPLWPVDTAQLPDQPSADARAAAAAPTEGAALRRPALAFRGFKPSHEKLMKQLRQGGGRKANGANVSNSTRESGEPPAPTATRPTHSGGTSPVQSLLQSPAVLLGSPRPSAQLTPAGSTASRAAAAAGTRAHQMIPYGAPHGGGADGRSTSAQLRGAGAGHTTGAGRSRQDEDEGAELESGRPAWERSPPRAPQMASSLLLLHKMEALQQVAFGEGALSALPTAPLSAAQMEEAARRAATAAANFPRSAQLYPNLPPVDFQPPQPPKIVKQLHPGWVASRQAKPEMSTMWRGEDHTPEVCNTRGVSLYTPPTAAQIASSLLQWR